MQFPIQAAPIDRANRAIKGHAAARNAGIGPSLAVGSIFCTICKFLPPPYNAICPIICPT